MKRVLTVLGSLLLLAIAALYFVVPSVMENGINIVEDHAPYAISEETRTLHDRLIVADLHSDTLLWARNPLARGRTGHVDVPVFRKEMLHSRYFPSSRKHLRGKIMPATPATRTRLRF